MQKCYSETTTNMTDNQNKRQFVHISQKFVHLEVDLVLLLGYYAKE